MLDTSPIESAFKATCSCLHSELAKMPRQSKTTRSKGAPSPIGDPLPDATADPGTRSAPDEAGEPPIGHPPPQLSSTSTELVLVRIEYTVWRQTGKSDHPVIVETTLVPTTPRPNEFKLELLKDAIPVEVLPKELSMLRTPHCCFYHTTIKNTARDVVFVFTFTMPEAFKWKPALFDLKQDDSKKEDDRKDDDQNDKDPNQYKFMCRMTKSEVASHKEPRTLFDVDIFRAAQTQSQISGVYVWEHLAGAPTERDLQRWDLQNSGGLNDRSTHTMEMPVSQLNMLPDHLLIASCISQEIYLEGNLAAENEDPTSLFLFSILNTLSGFKPSFTAKAATQANPTTY